MEYEEHEKRAWSVDFSRTEPSMLVSGSDDCKVVLKLEIYGNRNIVSLTICCRLTIFLLLITYML